MKKETTKYEKKNVGPAFQRGQKRATVGCRIKYYM